MVSERSCLTKYVVCYVMKKSTVTKFTRKYIVTDRVTVTVVVVYN